MLMLLGSLTACSDDDDKKWNDGQSKIELPGKRAFILNQGKSKDNNANIAFYAPNKDAKSSTGNLLYKLYFLQNGENLGDTGQDIIEHEDNIYVVLYNSSKLVKMNTACVKEAEISFSAEDGKPRYMAADNGKIYVTLYSGKVARIDARTMKIETYANVGKNPEQIVKSNGKLYVANSGWGAEKTVSVIDLKSFSKEKDIEVVINPNLLLEVDKEVYVISFGNFNDIPYSFQRIKADGTAETIATASFFASHNGIIYLAHSDITDWKEYAGTNKFFSYNTKTHKLNNESFLKNAPQAVAERGIRGMDIDPKTGEIYIYTYGKGLVNGDVFRFKSDGTFVETFDCGGLFPSKIIFLQ